MDILIPEAIILGLVVGLVFHRLVGYLAIPIVGLGAGVYWAATHMGDVEGGTADIFNNQAPELIADTALTFAFAGGEAALACWAMIALLNYLRVLMGNRRGRAALTGSAPRKPERPT